MYYSNITRSEALDLLTKSGYEILIYGYPTKIDFFLDKIMTSDSQIKGLLIPDEGNPMESGCKIYASEPQEGMPVGSLGIPCRKGWSARQAGDDLREVHFTDEGLNGTGIPARSISAKLSVRQDFLYPDNWYVIYEDEESPLVLFAGHSEGESGDWATKAEKQLKATMRARAKELIND